MVLHLCQWLNLDRNLSADAQSRLRDSWTKMYGSSQNAGKIINSF